MYDFIPAYFGWRSIAALENDLGENNVLISARIVAGLHFTKIWVSYD